MPRTKKKERAKQGEGSFRYRPGGTIEYRICYYDEYGVSRRKSFTGNTEDECIEKRNAFLQEIEMLKNDTGLLDTIPDILKRKYELDLKLNYVGPSGYRRNKETLKILENSPIGHVPIRKITKNQIMLYLASITHYSNSTIEKSFQQLKTAFKIAFDNGVIEKNIMSAVEIKRPKSDKPDKVVRGYTVEEQNVLLETMLASAIPRGRNDYRRQILIELYTGMRMGEINALTPDDVDFEKKIIKVRRTIAKDVDEQYYVKGITKTTAGQRDIPMNSNAEKVLRSSIQNKKRNKYNLIFYDYNKKSVVITNQVNSYFRRVCEKAGIPFNGQHALRHTFATRCIESGIQPIVLKKWMGHTDIHVTLDTYADVFDRMNDDSLEQLNKYLDETQEKEIVNF